MSDLVRSTDALDELPLRAVIESHDNEIYQKLEHRFLGAAWFIPGDSRRYSSSWIELPARLLDDGL